VADEQNPHARHGVETDDLVLIRIIAERVGDLRASVDGLREDTKTAHDEIRREVSALKVQDEVLAARVAAIERVGKGTRTGRTLERAIVAALTAVVAWIGVQQSEVHRAPQNNRALCAALRASPNRVDASRAMVDYGCIAPAGEEVNGQ
jgi:hypothetical protein